jgi:beta-galactosidase
MLFSHEQLNAFQIQPQADGFDYLGNFKRFHSAFLRMGVGVDVINWREDFRGYKLVVAPMLYLIDDAIAGKLKGYVENGGTLVLTTRSGVKNMNNVCLPDRLPNLLTDLAGVYVDEYDPVGKDVQNLILATGEGLASSQWCDILTPLTAETLATYASEYFAGEAAVTRNAFGHGAVYYIGTVLDERGSQVLMKRVAGDAGIDCELELPDGVEVAIRSSEERRVVFVLNLSREPKEVSLPARNYVSALSDRRILGESIKIEPGGVEILVEVNSTVTASA